MKDLSTYFYDSIYESICALDDLDEVINYYGNPQECTMGNYFAAQICDGKLYDHPQEFSEDTYLCDVEDYENEFQDQLKSAFNDWIESEIDDADEDELLKSILLKAQKNGTN